MEDIVASQAGMPPAGPTSPVVSTQEEVTPTVIQTLSVQAETSTQRPDPMSTPQSGKCSVTERPQQRSSFTAKPGDGRHKKYFKGGRKRKRSITYRLCSSEDLFMGNEVFIQFDNDKPSSKKKVTITSVGKENVWVSRADCGEFLVSKTDLFSSSVHSNVKQFDDDKEIDTNEKKMAAQFVNSFLKKISQEFRDSQLIIQEQTLKLKEKQKEFDNATERFTIELERAASRIHELEKLLIESLSDEEKQDTAYNDLLDLLKKQEKRHGAEVKDLKAQVKELEKENKRLKHLVNEQNYVIDQQRKELSHNKTVLADSKKYIDDQKVQISQNEKSITSLKDTIDGIFKGKKGEIIGVKPKLCNIKKSVVLKMPAVQKKASDVAVNTLLQRELILENVVNYLAGANTEEDKVLLLKKYLIKHPNIALALGKQEVLKPIAKLTPDEAIDLKFLLRLPMRRMRQLRNYLKNHKISVLPSDKDLYDAIRDRQEGDSDLEVGYFKYKNEDVAYVKLDSLDKCIHKMLGDYDESKGRVWIKFGGDKGGSEMKIGVSAAFVDQPDQLVRLNSADHVNLVAMWEAPETHENICKMCGSYYETLSELQEKVNVNVFYGGDLCYHCCWVGHHGSKSTKFCIYCLAELTDLKPGEPHSPNCKEFQLRTPEMYMENAAFCIADPRNNYDVRKNGKFHNSVIAQPCYPLKSIWQIVPIPLHLLLGLILKYYNMVVKAARKKDRMITSNGSDVEYDNVVEQLSEKCQVAEEQEAKVDEMEASVKFVCDVLKKCEMTKASKIVTKDKCSAPYCLLGRFRDENVSWVQCDMCQKWLHSKCVLYENTEHEDEEFLCPACLNQSHEDFMQIHNDRLDQMQQELTIAKSQLSKVNVEITKLTAHLDKLQGPKEKKLTHILVNDLKVKRQAYHSGSFVGNHCKIILEEYPKLLIVYDDDEDLHRKFSLLFQKTKYIFSFFGARFLTDQEIAALTDACHSFGEWFGPQFPDESITPKQHLLVHHVPTFVQKWRTIGLLSEAPFESIHALVNNQNRVYQGVSGATKKLELVFKNHALRATADSSKIKGPDRVCNNPGCTGRYKTEHGVRKCQKCSL